MSLVFGAITPHPPLLIPNVGRENLERVKNSESALKDLANDLYASKPDTVIIISPHAPISEDTFLINACEKFECNFEEFGDFETSFSFKPDLEFSADIKMRSQDEDIPLNLVCTSQLDHGIAVPLFYLMNNLKDVPVVPISFTFLDVKTHYEFGQLLQKEIMITNKRIAVIASGDLSHAITPEAPAGFNENGKEFDEMIVELLKKKDEGKILKLDPKFVEEAAECGYRSIVILLGILKGINYKPKVLAYEHPFGVGYLTCNFSLE
ncbi:AmmeMemoRadiSam system protein B [Patescibacteria group bacterium]|nr:AmmeMemoRadiSam system protein B [Patescibacteria group bacterium]MBU1951522.1 AmmeMemoRadiSam system protein B [Patescibacteria group bacterium]